MYQIEVRPASKNGWFTPAESNAFYKLRYARTAVSIHWWGDGTGASNHDNIVNYMLNQSAAGNKSTNYVLSDNKITETVNPDNVSWCSGPNGNAVSISIELQPTLGVEGYRKAGWLVAQLEKRYGPLPLVPHSTYQPTACPGSIDINRIRREADAFKGSAVATAKPTQGDPDMAITRDDVIREYIVNRGVHPTEGEIAAHLNGGNMRSLSYGFEAENQQRRNQTTALLNTVNDLQSQLAGMAQAVAQAQANDSSDAASIAGGLAIITDLTTKLGEANDKLKAAQEVVIPPTIPPTTPPALPESTTPTASPLVRLLAWLIGNKKG